MSANLVALAYLIASVFFILALKGLSSPVSARRGNVFGILGMIIAVTTTLTLTDNWQLILGCIAVGGTIGAIVAKRVQMTAMPELVAFMHSLVGLAAVFIAIAAINNPTSFGLPAVLPMGSKLELFLGTFIGAVNTTGAGGTAGSTFIPQPSLVTSGVDSYWVEGELVPASGAATVTVNDGMTFQDWLGFGGTFNEAGWDALSVLPEAERNRAIVLLFSDTEGAGFDWGRIPIGASDYAISRYTLAETPNDLTMENFSIDRDRQMLIPYIKAAQAVKSDIKMWGSPWSPPAWMKSSNNIDGTDADPDGNGATFESSMLSDSATLQAHALYFARFIEEYELEGIPIDHVQPQNEPGYATRYPSCLWAGGLLGSFVGDYLGPTLAERGLSTGIWFGARTSFLHANPRPRWLTPRKPISTGYLLKAEIRGFW
jgi:hypothetical protein